MLLNPLEYHHLFGFFGIITHWVTPHFLVHSPKSQTRNLNIRSFRNLSFCQLPTLIIPPSSSFSTFFVIRTDLRFTSYSMIWSFCLRAKWRINTVQLHRMRYNNPMDWICSKIRMIRFKLLDILLHQRTEQMSIRSLEAIWDFVDAELLTIWSGAVLIAYFCLSLNVEQYMECERPPQSVTIDVGDGAELEINGTTTNGQNAEK